MSVTNKDNNLVETVVMAVWWVKCYWDGGDVGVAKKI